MESFTLDKLAKIIGGDVLGVGDFIINSIEDSSTCSKSGICYLKDKKYLVSSFHRRTSHLESFCP